ncbi:hypothetical protein GeomeDRAFT_2518 [Geobacter metallireducens RCH3]|nr:hypothetical protein GeomeDRAFT_2518 [Geobacter metallireducens RCH3]
MIMSKQLLMRIGASACLLSERGSSGLNDVTVYRKGMRR